MSTPRKKSESGSIPEAVPNIAVETSPIGGAKKRTRTNKIVKTTDPDSQAKMKQKLKLKSKCFQCGNTKWCIDFKEHSYNKITRRSICQFCELEKLIRKQSVEIIALKQQLKQQEESSNTKYAETVKMIADSQAEYQHLKHDITENAKKITTFESEWKNFKECKNYDAKKTNMNLSAVERQCTNSEEQLKSEEQFRVVSKRKTAKPSEVRK